MADEAEPEAGSSGTKIEDVHPEDFVLADFIQEIATLIQERQDFLNSKVERRAIGGPEKNIALFRLIRMRALHHYLKRIEAHQRGTTIQEDDTLPAPEYESPLKDFVEEIEAEADKALPPKQETPAPEPAPVEEPESDWD